MTTAASASASDGVSSAPAWRVWVPWIALVVVVVVALYAGTVGGGDPSPAARAQALEESIRCPSCPGQAVSQSETPSAKGVKVIIRDQIAAGRSDEEIREYVAGRFGRDVLLDPSSRGFGALVWALPVVFAVVAVFALVYRFRDWRPGLATVTDADRELVADALQHLDDDAPDSAAPDEAAADGGSPTVGAAAADTQDPDS